MTSGTNEKLKLKIAVLSLPAVMACTFALSPMLAEVARAFPQAETSLVQMIITLPSLVALPVSFLAGRLEAFVSKKKLALAGLSVCLAGGVIPMLSHKSVCALLVGSGIMGLGMGFMTVMSSVLIAAYFQGEERGTMMGLQSAAVSIGGAAISAASGMLASVKWYYGYYTLLVILPVIAVLQLMLPSDNPELRIEESSEKKPAKKINGGVIYYGLLTGLFSLFVFTFSTNIAMLLDESGLGGAGTSGIVTSAYSFIGILAGVLLGRLLVVCGRLTIPLAFLLSGLGLLLITFAGSLPLVIFGALLVGFGYAVRAPAGFFYVSKAVEPASPAMAIAVFSAFGMVGQFLSPVVINGLTKILDLNINGKFLISGTVMIIIFALASLKCRYASDEAQ